MDASFESDEAGPRGGSGLTGEVILALALNLYGSQRCGEERHVVLSNSCRNGPILRLERRSGKRSGGSIPLSTGVSNSISVSKRKPLALALLWPKLVLEPPTGALQKVMVMLSPAPSSTV